MEKILSRSCVQKKGGGRKTNEGREKMEKVAKNSLALPNLVASDYK